MKHKIAALVDSDVWVKPLRSVPVKPNETGEQADRGYRFLSDRLTNIASPQYCERKRVLGVSTEPHWLPWDTLLAETLHVLVPVASVSESQNLVACNTTRAHSPCPSLSGSFLQIKNLVLVATLQRKGGIIVWLKSHPKAWQELQHPKRFQGN
jgi:hypothetical protein